MNSTVAVLLTQDALINGAIYALIAMTLVMIFSVTRVILVSQGEIISFAALTLAAIERGSTPGTVWLLCAGGLLAAVMELYSWWRNRDDRAIRAALVYAVYPVIIAILAVYTLPVIENRWYQMLLTVLIVSPLGLVSYRIVFKPLVHASVLVLLIAAVALHFVLTGFGLMVFGAEGVRTTPIIAGALQLGGFPIRYQGIVVIAATAVLIFVMAMFFGRTLTGKALRATAFNRTGARLVGIRTEYSGALAFFLAGLIGTISGMLIAPMTTVYYDTGFLIGLKGFVASIVGGLHSYPLAAAGAVLVGLIESYSSFWASTFKEVLVFTLIIPVLLWRNLTAKHEDEEDEE